MHEFVLGGLSVISYVILYKSTIIVSHTMHTHAAVISQRFHGYSHIGMHQAVQTRMGILDRH